MDTKWYLLSTAGRVLLSVYGEWQDRNMVVKFTDVDYQVFTDAARFTTKGESPYLRSTYRYTPLLAWMLTLNIWVSTISGKLIFIAFDIAAGHLIYKISRLLGNSHRIATYCALFWLFNPLCAVISSRGNAEPIMACLVLASLYFLIQRNLAVSAVFYALAIHFKIYPITYALPIYLFLGRDSGFGLEKIAHKKVRPSTGKNVIEDDQTRVTNKLGKSLLALLPNKERLIFMCVGGLVLGTLTAFFYWWYGWIFLYETYLYHVVRGDIRHNFSPYFYLLYLTSDPVRGVPLCLRLLVFLPQLALLVVTAWRYHRDQPLCWFLSTFLFVMVNKVCTSQYFQWYLSLLPLVLPQLNLSLRESVTLLVLWFGAQALWLYPAYLLEFEGLNVFLYIWLAGLLFLAVNAFVVYKIVGSYKSIRRKLK